MYDSFFKGNIFAYIEFYVIFGMSTFLLYKNSSSINLFIKKLNKGKKLLIVPTFILISTLLYLAMDIKEVSWIIGVAVNSIILALIVYFVNPVS